MYIALMQRGGYLGLDRKVEVQDGGLTITENGAVKPTQGLDPAQRAQLEDLAAKAVRASGQLEPRTGTAPSDSMDTELEIEIDGTRTKLALGSGDQAPGDLWQLIGEISKLST
jgi:hypothetical protein